MTNDDKLMERKDEAIECLAKFFAICESNSELYREILEDIPIELAIRLRGMAEFLAGVQ